MALGKSRDADAKSAPVRIDRRVPLNFRMNLYQVGRMLKIVVGLAVFQALRSVASQGKNVAHARRGVAFKNLGDFVLLMADTGEMRDRTQGSRLSDAHDEVVGELSRRTAGAIGHADEMRLIGLQLADGLVKTFHRLGAFRRKEFKRERGASGFENVFSVHG